MRPPEFRCEVIEGDYSSIDPLRSAWDALCDEGLCRDPFYRPDWISAWCKAFAPTAKIRIVLAYQGTQLRALIPLILDPQRGGILRSPTNFHSCRFGPVYGQGDHRSALAALWEALLTTRNWKMLELQEVVEEGEELALKLCLPTHGVLTSVRTAYRSASILIPEGSTTLDGALGTRHAQFRRDIQKKERRLVRAEQVRFEPDAPCTEETIATFLTLEAAGWKGRSNSAVLSDNATENFYRAIFRQEAAKGRLRFGILRAGETVIAMNFALQEGDTFYVPKTCYHEQYATYSPGQLLFYKTLEWCVANNIRNFHFLGPTTAWKERWSTYEISHQAVRLFRHSLVGYALYFRYHLLPKIRPYLTKKK